MAQGAIEVIDGGGEDEGLFEDESVGGCEEAAEVSDSEVLIVPTWE